STDMARRFEPPCSLAGDTLSPIAGWDGAVTVTKGYREDVLPQRIYPGKNGIITIEIRELERLVIHFPASVINRSLLPIGSTLDSKKGIFYWQPGPGFIGNYEFVFTNNKGKHTNQININILPGQ
ncbi:MAG TPA: hypothetical protein VK186_16820, partial [Candidatus Deferrimicrobium sp.]|nr:hypothetical protein [Candidatus Deferrimicrobium sp.]